MKQTKYSVVKWAKFLKVSASGYNEWKKERDAREIKLFEYKEKIQEVFNKSNGTYGIDRLCGALRQNGETASYKRVKKLMIELNLKSIHNRRRQRSLTDSRKSRGEGYENLVKGLEITKPFQVITSDISYIRTAEGFDYLCEIKDVVTGIVLGHHMQSRMTKDLVVKTIQKAHRRWRLKSGTIFHSDRGSQYTSDEVKSFLNRLKINQSFSRVGKPGDNAWSESFFANLKKEAVHWRHFQTREEARHEIFKYIEGFYNTKRIQKRLGYISPIQWLKNNEMAALKLVA